MTSGYLYYDASKSTLEQKILNAVEYHVRKAGITPSLCLVHIKDFKEGEYLVTTRPYQGIPKGHFWVGVEDGSSD